LLIDITTTAHLPGPQNPGECHLYFAEGCHLYMAATHPCRRIGFMVTVRPSLPYPSPEGLRRSRLAGAPVEAQK
jgi:hypothetical protein